MLIWFSVFRIVRCYCCRFSREMKFHSNHAKHQYAFRIRGQGIFFWCVCNQTPKWTQIYFRCGTVLSSAFAQHIIYIQIVDTYRKSHLMFYLFVFETSTTSSSSIAKSLASNTFRYTFWPINNRQRNFDLHTCESCNRFLLQFQKGFHIRSLFLSLFRFLHYRLVSHLLAESAIFDWLIY